MRQSIRAFVATVASTSLMTSAMAVECPAEKEQYAQALLDGQTIVSLSQEVERDLRLDFKVRFDVTRNERTVWSLSGSIDCIKWTWSCYLQLDRKTEFENDADTATKTKEETMCLEQPIFIIEIRENEEERYLSFGGIDFMSKFCGKYLDFKVNSKNNLNEEEREGLFSLPEYMTFRGCKP